LNPNSSSSQVPSPYFEQEGDGGASRKTLKKDPQIIGSVVDLPRVEDDRATLDRIESKRLKRAMYDAIEIRPLQTERLKPIKVDN
jgi:hypothetical protein